MTIRDTLKRLPLLLALVALLGCTPAAQRAPLGPQPHRLGLVAPFVLAANGAAATSLVVANKPGFLYQANFYNSNASTRYLQLFDATALPANATVPLLIVAVPTKQTASIDLGTTGRPFAVGIVLANSTTDTTLTVGSADGTFDAVYYAP